MCKNLYNSYLKMSINMMEIIKEKGVFFHGRLEDSIIVDLKA